MNIWRSWMHVPAPLHPLATLLLERGLISEADLDEVLAAQAVFGGSFDTNLIELTGLGERQLQPLLEECFGIKNAVSVRAPGDLEVAALLAPEVAAALRAVPVRRAGRAIDVIMNDLRAVTAIDEVAARTGLRVTVSVACEIRVAWHLHDAYGVKPDRRLARLLEAPVRDESLVRPMLQPLPPDTTRPTATAEMQESIEMPPDFAAGEFAGLSEVTPLPAPAPEPAARATTPLPARPAVDVSEFLPPLPRPATPVPVPVPVPAPAPAPTVDPHSGPVWTGTSSLDPAFAAVGHRDELPPLVLGWLQNRLLRTVLFVVRRDHVTGWDARGGRLRRESVETISFSTAIPSVMATACQYGEPFIGPLPFDDVEQSLMVKLGGDWPEHVVVWPIRVGARTVAMVYGEARSQIELQGARAAVGEVVSRVEQVMLRLVQRQTGKP